MLEYTRRFSSIQHISSAQGPNVSWHLSRLSEAATPTSMLTHHQTWSHWSRFQLDALTCCHFAMWLSRCTCLSSLRNVTVNLFQLHSPLDMGVPQRAASTHASFFKCVNKGSPWAHSQEDVSPVNECYSLVLGKYFILYAKHNACTPSPIKYVIE